MRVMPGLGKWRVAASQETEQEEEENVVVEDNGSKAAQLLGIRGASQETNIWKIRLQLTKPVTWVPLIWGHPSSLIYLSLFF